MESSLLLSSARPLKPSLVAPSSSSFARRRCASFGPKLLFRRLPSLPPRARRWSVAPRAASEAFDGIQSQDKPPGVGRGGARRRAYREEQGEPVARPLGAGAGGITRYIVPAGALLALSFVIWKVVENFLPLKRKDQNSGEPTSSGVTWSFAAGSNLSTSTSIKAQKESKKNLNKFYKELRTLKTVNMAGRQFGDEGLFFLAESLAYNKSAEEVDFSGNAITAAGIEAFDGILQINTALKTLNLSGNIIGDEGAKIYWLKT
uniref:Protein NLRC3 n=2 Tax=Triticinae TaxID=1648030 RepID=A0A8R7QX20_TRIUA